MDIQAFIAHWRLRTHLKERTASQSHFNDLCAALNVPSPLKLIRTGTTTPSRRERRKPAAAIDLICDVLYSYDTDLLRLDGEQGLRIEIPREYDGAHHPLLVPLNT